MCSISATCSTVYACTSPGLFSVIAAGYGYGGLRWAPPLVVAPRSFVLVLVWWSGVVRSPGGAPGPGWCGAARGMWAGLRGRVAPGRAYRGPGRHREALGEQARRSGGRALRAPGETT